MNAQKGVDNVEFGSSIAVLNSFNACSFTLWRVSAEGLGKMR